MSKTVAESNSIPSVAGELEASPTPQSGAEQSAPVSAEAPLSGVAKARAVKAAKAKAKMLAEVRAEALAEAEALIEAKKASQLGASKSIGNVQTALAAEHANDRLSFGEIREVGRTIPTAEEYVKVEIPLTDLFDHSHPGVQLNRHKFEPGKTYLLRGDVALEVKRRLAMFHDEQVRLLRPNADRKALNDVNRGSQWTSRGGVHALGSLEDVPVASDERIYTVDF